jgi:hypothetical protein
LAQAGNLGHRLKVSHCVNRANGLETGGKLASMMLSIAEKGKKPDLVRQKSHIFMGERGQISFPAWREISVCPANGQLFNPDLELKEWRR